MAELKGWCQVPIVDPLDETKLTTCSATPEADVPGSDGEPFAVCVSHAHSAAERGHQVTWRTPPVPRHECHDIRCYNDAPHDCHAKDSRECVVWFEALRANAIRRREQNLQDVLERAERKVKRRALLRRVGEVVLPYLVRLAAIVFTVLAIVGAIALLRGPQERRIIRLHLEPGMSCSVEGEDVRCWRTDGLGA